MVSLCFTLVHHPLGTRDKEIKLMTNDITIIFIGRTLPSFRDVFMLYCGLSPGATVRDLCTRYNPGNLRVDER